MCRRNYNLHLTRLFLPYRLVCYCRVGYNPPPKTGSYKQRCKFVLEKVAVQVYMMILTGLQLNLQYRSKLGGAVAISAIANRATSGSRLHHQQQQNKSIRERWRTKSQMKLRPSTCVMSWLWHKRDAQRRILHRVVCFFLIAATTTVISSPSTSG